MTPREGPPAPPSRQEWFLHPRIKSCAHLAHLLLRRLHQAMGVCGHVDEGRALAYVGEECMAIARRLYGGWPAVCGFSEDRMRAVSWEIARHLWAVRIDGVAPLAAGDRAREAAATRPGGQAIGGKELLLTLAEAVGNDADLVPICEAQGVRVDRERARRAAQEMYAQWSQSPATPKATFRRALSRRLRQEGATAPPSPVFRR